MRPQPGIFALGTRSHNHLQFDVIADDVSQLAGAIATVREAATTVSGVNVVAGFRPSLWATIASDNCPNGLDDFSTITGPDGFAMPAEQHDLWLWLHGAGPDAVFNAARNASIVLAPFARVAAEQQAFTYQSSQDLTGFEDGTENPPLDEAVTAAIIPDDSPCAGGSVVLVQRWVHDLDGFEAMELADREKVIGRTLQGSVELDTDAMPPNAHVARVVIENESGDELEIFRRSTAFGGVLEHGLMFVGFSPEWSRLESMLRRMAGADDGVRDRLTEFSTPVATAVYVVPPIDLLGE